MGRAIEHIFAGNLKKYRKCMDLTQGELAEKLGVDKVLVNRWENGGFPKLQNIKALAKELRIEEAKLFLDISGMGAEEALEVLGNVIKGQGLKKIKN